MMNITPLGKEGMEKEDEECLYTFLQHGLLALWLANLDPNLRV